MIKSDFHIHSSCSADSTASMESMIQQGIALGLTNMCFTEHMDYDFQVADLDFELDTDHYRSQFLKCREKYGSKIHLLFGVELGLQTHLAMKNRDYINRYPFDFVIGSSHLVRGFDPYYPEFFRGRSEQEAYLEYFSTILDNLKTNPAIDVYGHLDYVVRYGPNKNQYYSYEKYKDILDEILVTLIHQGIGIELNTGGFKADLGHPNPHQDIIKAYHDMGGEIITIGADAHAPGYLAYEFEKATAILHNCGFDYYTIFKNRKPEFIRLD